MTLKEMSASYDESAAMLSRILRRLRRQLRNSGDAAERHTLRCRIKVLRDVLTQTRELAQLTAHYYERGYWRNEKYTL